jgi:hypothetical protein
MHDDLVNNRFLRNAERKEYSAVASLKWQPDEHWELLAGGRWNRVDVHDRNRLATPDAYEVQGQYRYTELLNGNPALPSWRAKRIALLNWYPDANGNLPRNRCWLRRTRRARWRHRWLELLRRRQGAGPGSAGQLDLVAADPPS